MLHLAHIQLLDSALPTGGFSHSFGLETLVQSGRVRTADDLREWCETMLFGAWASGEEMGVLAVYEWAPSERWDELWELDRAMHVARAARETREGTRKIGRRLLGLGRAMYPDLTWSPLVEAVESGWGVGAMPLVYGWTCWQLGVSRDEAGEGFLYVCLSGSLANAVRLMRLGSTQSQSILAAMLPLVSQAWHENAGREPREFAFSVPSSDIAQMEHETLYSRLFMS